MSESRKSECVSQITQFYSQKSLLITGCTGFIGKVILEKILYACEDVGTVYVLIRRKNGLSAESRIRKLLSCAPFTARNLKSSQTAKVIAIEGNIEEENLGISEKDRLALIENVNLVIHGAANVRFNASFRSNINTNIYGTERIIELVKQMKNLHCFAQISTAYSNCQHIEIDEKLYPLSLDLESTLKILSNADDDKLDFLSDQLFEGRPNSYIYTKAVAEHLVSERMRCIPTAIIRPPIVTPSVAEPVPGWVDTLNGPAGLLMAASIGVLRTSDWRYDIEPDGMPVDLVSNAILSIVCNMSTQSESLSVYNITWRNLNDSFAYPDGHILFKLAIDAYLKAPYSLAFRPVFLPDRINMKSKLRYTLEKFFYHFILAFVIDTLISCFGYKRMLVNYVKRMHYALDIMKYFGTREWKINCDNTIKVLKSLNECDRKLFEFDGRSYKEMSYIADAFWIGARRYLLKDDDSTITVAKRRYLMVLVAYHMFYVFMCYFVLTLASKIMVAFGYLLPQNIIVAICVVFGLSRLVKGLFDDVPRLMQTMRNYPRCC